MPSHLKTILKSGSKNKYITAISRLTTTNAIRRNAVQTNPTTFTKIIDFRIKFLFRTIHLFIKIKYFSAGQQVSRARCRKNGHAKYIK